MKALFCIVLVAWSSYRLFSAPDVKDGCTREAEVGRETLAFNLDFWRFFYVCAPGAAQDPGIRRAMEKDDDGAYSQALRGYTPDEAGCLAYIDDILRSGVTRFISNINAQRCNVDSKVLEPVWVNGEVGSNPQFDQLVSKGARILHERGVNPHKVWFRRCRERRVEPWLSIRMNDMHGSDTPGSAAVSDFWRMHPEYRRYPDGVPSNVWFWASQSLDYSHEPVRRRMLAFIGECIDNYDIDGIELDYTRFVWFFRPGREKADAHYLTEFQRQVRSLTDAAAKHKGRPVRISLRLLACPETEKALGFELEKWAAEGLMDVVDVGCHYCSNDYEIPVGDWRKLLGNRIEILPHCDNGHIVGIPGRFRRLLNQEEYAGFADVMYAKGCDGLSLFNLFGFPVDAPEWNEILVEGLGRERISRLPRRYPLSYRDMDHTEGAAKAYPKVLPSDLKGGFRCSLPVGTLPADGTAQLIIGLHPADAAGALPQASVNGKSLPAFTPSTERHCRGFSSPVRLDGLIAGHNEVVLSPACGRIVYVAIRVEPSVRATPPRPASADSVRWPGDFHRPERRQHVGIPSVAVSPVNGRMWATWYNSTTRGEDMNAYVSLLTSDDDGKTWREVLVADPDKGGPRKAFDPNLWIAPDGRLRWTWTERMCDPSKNDFTRDYGGDEGDPKTDELMMAVLDAERLPTERPSSRRIARGVMLGKPVALNNGEWLFPSAHWNEAPSACVYVTADGGRTFSLRGGATIPPDQRLYDEHQLAVRENGDIVTYIRANWKNAHPWSAVSHDNGRTWMRSVHANYEHTSSRLFVRRLRSGSWLLVKNGPIDKDVSRKQMTAFLSQDEGRTWKGGLVLDARDLVSYPDGDQRADGVIVVIHDRDRMGAKEILFSTFTEDDVLAGRNVSGKVTLLNPVNWRHN